MAALSVIEKRILAGLGVILAVPVVVGVLVVSGLREIQSKDQWLVDVHGPALVQAERLRYFAESEISNSRGFLLNGDRRDFLSKVSESRANFLEILNLMESQVLPDHRPMLPERKEIFRQIRDFESQYHEAIAASFQLREAEVPLERILEINRVHALPARLGLDSALDKLVDTETRFLLETREKSRQTMTRIQKSLGFVFGASFLIVAILTFWILRLFRRNQSLLNDTRKAVAARDEVLSVVSHDLKNPLAAIDLGVQMLLRNKAAAPAHQAIARRIASAVKSMKSLIQNLLDSAKFESGHLTLERAEHGIRDTLSELLTIQEPLANDRSIHLEVELPDPGLTASFDPERIGQVLSNLVGNAIKFTRPGGTVRVRTEPSVEGICFSVSDTGPGIPAEQLPRIFDRYWQARETARYGTGLGLAIAKGLVEAHGGRIWVESAVGSGSTFYFTLPRAPAGLTSRHPTDAHRERTLPGSSSNS